MTIAQQAGSISSEGPCLLQPKRRGAVYTLHLEITQAACVNRMQEINRAYQLLSEAGDE